MKDLEYYEQIISSRRYWDSGASEFSGVEIEKKLVALAQYLELGGNLHYIVSRYKSSRMVYVREAVRGTIAFYLNYLADTKYVPFYGCTESQLITFLSKELNGRLFNDYNYSANTRTPRIRVGGLNPDWDLADDRDTLFFDNPWFDIAQEVQENSYLPSAVNIHAEDKKYIDEFNGTANECKYELGILPEPFFGNVLDAEVVILALNPRYNWENDRVRYDLLSDQEKLIFIKAQCNAMLLESDLLIPDDFHRNTICDYYWDNATTELLDSFEAANLQTALIHFIGYSSSEYKDLPKKLTRETYHLEDDILYTQKYAVRLVKYLMQQNRILIIPSHSKQWFSAVEGLATYPNLKLSVNLKQLQL